MVRTITFGKSTAQESFYSVRLLQGSDMVEGFLETI